MRMRSSRLWAEVDRLLMDQSLLYYIVSRKNGHLHVLSRKQLRRTSRGVIAGLMGKYAGYGGESGIRRCRERCDRASGAEAADIQYHGGRFYSGEW